MVSSALFTSATSDWSTPPGLFARLDQEFNFTVDVAASHANALCKRYYTEDNNGLTKDWVQHNGDPEVFWMNPPYGKDVHLWVGKASGTALDGGLGVGLLPARTDTKWWHTYIEPIRNRWLAGEVRFVRGRLKFGGAKNPAPFPSVVVVFGQAKGKLTYEAN